MKIQFSFCVFQEVIFKTADADDVENVWLRTAELHFEALASGVLFCAEHDAKAGAIDEMEFAEIDGKCALDEGTGSEVIHGCSPNFFGIRCGEFAAPGE